MTTLRIATLCAVLLAGGCGFKEEPTLASGDINGCQVRFTNARALADNVAQRHCGQYERVARFIGSGDNLAFYECDLK